MLLLLVGLVVALGLLYVHQRQIRQRSPNLHVEAYYPIIGSSLYIARFAHVMLDLLLEKCEEHGGKFQFKVPGQPFYACITDPECVKHVLQDNFDNYEKGDFFRDRFFDLLGMGIFDVDGAEWRFQRKTASHIFTRNELRGFMTDVFRDHAQLFLDRLDQHAVSGKPLNFQDLFYRYTLESIGKIAFGVNLGCFEREKVDFAIAFDQAQQILMDRSFTPIWGIRRYLKWLHPDERALTKCVTILNAFAMSVIADRRKEVDLDRKEDLLSRFMNVRDDQGKPLDDHHLRDVIMSFIIAGRDTTANALTWLFDELTLHPDVCAKLVEEIDRVLQGSTPTYEDVDKRLPYLSACAKETLRLHPSVPKDVKIAIHDDVLPDGTIIKAGCGVVYLPYVMGRMEKLWGKDAREFRPERWLDGLNPSPFQFIAFNAGPRICLGMNMALIEMKILAASILQKFHVHRQPGFKSHYAISLTLPMQDGLFLTVERRQA